MTWDKFDKIIVRAVFSLFGILLSCLIAALLVFIAAALIGAFGVARW